MGHSLEMGSQKDGWLLWLRINFFRRWYDAVFTISLAALFLFIVIKILRWGFLDAAFYPDSSACRYINGACWSVIVDMWPLFIAGLYPADERWRVYSALLLILFAILITMIPRFRRPRFAAALWISVLITFSVLVHGGIFGFVRVDLEKWGGLLLTLVLAVVSQSIAFPFGIVLALGRYSRQRSALRMVSTLYIEIVRSVPLVMVLLMVTLVLPLFLPSTMTLNTVLTASIGIAMFSAAAIAEVVRGGLNGLSPGQTEAAFSLGLRYWQSILLIILPQALQRVQPALVGTFITFVKGSTLVVAIGLYDLLVGRLIEIFCLREKVGCGDFVSFFR